MRLVLVALSFALAAPLAAQAVLVDRFNDALSQPPEYNRATREGDALVVRSASCATTIPISPQTQVEADGNDVNRFVIRFRTPGIRIVCTSFRDDADTVLYPFQTAAARDRAVAAGRALVAKWEESAAISAVVSTCISGDCVDGAGVMEYRQDGELLRTYVGAFRDGRAHGRGTITFADGDVYAGAWTAGERRGIGVYHHAGGRTFVGTYASDVEAAGRIVEPDGTVRAVRLVNGSYVFE